MLKREWFRAALEANRGYDMADGQLLAFLVATHGSHGSWSAIFTSVKEPVLPVPPFHHLCSKLEGAVGVGLETQPLAATKQGSSSRQRPERSPDMLKYSAQHVAPFPLAAVGQEAPQAMARRMSTRAGMRSGEQLTRRRLGDAG